MRCGKCSADNREGRKFCTQCGSPLSTTCARCGAAIEPGERFCGDCGAPIGKSNPPPSAEQSSSAPIRVTDTATAENLEGERKTVTALFADIKGSTELMEDLDPEEARAIVDPALKLMIDAVRRYDGYVVQSTGDGIFALFGAPVAHEDHPQRALYAAVRLQEELKRQSDRLRADGGLPIQARIGVNTGEVVVRSIATGKGQTEYTPIGHTTNLASRMQTLAPIGSIAATEATRKLCEGYFNFRALGPTRVKGVAEPVGVHEVTGIGPLRTRLQRAAGRGLTKFVGREREMQALKHAAEQVSSGRGQIVAVMAEAGVGKSRLFFEFKTISQSSWMVLETFSVSHGKASAYLPVIELLWNYFRITSEDDERTRREKVTGRVLALERTLEDTLPYLFSLLGIVDGDDPLAEVDQLAKKRRTLEAIKRIVVRESMNQRVMVIFEDLHWIDEQTQELLNLLGDSIVPAKILLLVNYRPEYSHHWSGKSHYVQLRLDPLGRESADEMLTALLGDDPQLTPLKRLIIERTEGTPFFMEETVQVLFDEEALVRNGVVRLVKTLGELKIPPTVQAILAARIDRLPGAEKALLQTLAVIGREFPLSLVREVAMQTDDALERMLADLQNGEFIYEQPTFPEVEYVFKHALTQEVAYNSILSERRQQLHERAGRAFESIFADRLDNHLPELAHHYGRSGDRTKAIDYLELAGRQATQRSANAEAIRYISAGLEILKTLADSHQRSQRELALQTLLGPALIATKGNAAQEVEQTYLRVRELSERVDAGSQQFPALFNLRSVYFVRGEVLRAHELSQQLVRLAESEKDTGHLLEARLALGNTLHLQGALKPAQDQFEEALRIYDPEQHRSHAFIYGFDPGVFCQGRIIWTLPILGYVDQAVEKTRALLVLARKVSHPLSLALALMNSSEVYLLRHEANLVDELTELAMKIADEQGFANFLGQATVYSGAALAQKGQTGKGIARMRQGLAACRATGAVLFRPFYLRFLADGYLRAEDPTEGLAVVAEALSQMNRTEERLMEAELWRLKGELMRQIGLNALPEAEDCFHKAIGVARLQEAKWWELRSTTSLARLHRDTGRRDEARAMLAEIYYWFTEGFDTADLKDAKALLDELDE